MGARRVARPARLHVLRPSRGLAPRAPCNRARVRRVPEAPGKARDARVQGRVGLVHPDQAPALGERLLG
eukprot:961594-Pyramimonas_sp.AAC.1